MYSMESYFKKIQYDMISIQKQTDKLIDPSHSFAVSIDIDRAENKTWSVVETAVVDLLTDLERQPSSIYVCSTTMILFFRALDTGHHIFGGSHQKIISWFCGVANILFGVTKKEQLSIGVVTAFPDMNTATSYFLWASQMHYRSMLMTKVYTTNSKAKIDLKSLTVTELKSLIKDPMDANDLYGVLYKLDKNHEGRTIVIAKLGPYEPSKIREYTSIIF